MKFRTSKRRLNLPVSVFSALLVPALVVALAFHAPSGQSSLSAQVESKTAPVDVDDVLADYLEALGGEMSLLSVETIKCQFRYTGGTVATGHHYFKDGVFLTNGEYEGHGNHKKLYKDGVWYRTSKGAPPTKVTEQGSINSSLTFHNSPSFALKLRDQADQLSVLPVGEYASSDFADCICLISAKVEETHLRRFFDRETGVLVGVESWRNRSSGPATYHLQSRYFYEDVDGVMVVSRSVRSNKNGWITECVFDKYDINGEVDGSVFEIGELESTGSMQKDSENDRSE